MCAILEVFIETLSQKLIDYDASNQSMQSPRKSPAEEFEEQENLLAETLEMLNLSSTDRAVVEEAIALSESGSSTGGFFSDDRSGILDDQTPSPLEIRSPATSETRSPVITEPKTKGFDASRKSRVQHVSNPVAALNRISSASELKTSLSCVKTKVPDSSRIDVISMVATPRTPSPHVQMFESHPFCGYFA